MEIHLHTVGPFAENTYLLTRKGQSLIVDPGFSGTDEYQSFKDKITTGGTSPVAVCLTHAHIDHILGLHYVLSDYDIPVYLNHSDLYLWKNYESQAAMFGFRVNGYNFIPTPLPEQNSFVVGEFKFDVLYTPGHSPDHVSLYFDHEKSVIAGDLLFKESVGRTDLYKGSFDLLQKSVRDKLFALPDDTKVYPGHGPETSVGYEKKFNPFVNNQE